MKFARNVSRWSSQFALLLVLGFVRVNGADKPISDLARKEFLEVKAKAEAGTALAQNDLALRYKLGNGVKEDRAQAIKWFRKAAEQNLVLAEYNLGVLLCQAEDSKKKEFEEGFKWLQRAAEQNYAPAQVTLGALFHDGEGVEKDYAEAQKWYRRAAEQNFAPALSNIGLLYEQGQGVEKDYAEAAKWYRRAAELDDTTAQNTLAIMYSKGQGVEKSMVEAYALYNLAAKGSADAATARDDLEPRMSVQQVAEAQKRARELRSVIEKNLRPTGAGVGH